MIKFNILKKPECPVCQTEISNFYSAKMVNISKYRSTLYISQVGPCRHVFQDYAHVSWTIWLNFTQKIKKCFKLQEDELNLKI
jgi:hypothetical protein